MRGMDIAQSDSTMIVRSDTPPALWRWSVSANKWLPLVTAYSMPTAYQTSFGTNAAAGCWEARICPSNTQKFYMFYGGTIGSGPTIPWVTTNQGGTWTAANGTGFPTVTDVDANANGSAEFNYKMAVDPHNDAIVYLGLPSQGLWKTTNSGGSWAQDTGVTASTSIGIAIAFDPASVVGGVTQTIYACSNGQGVWRTTNAGGSWTKLNTTGMPTAYCQMVVDSTGKLWLSTGTGSRSVWTWTPSTWVNNSVSDGIGLGPIAVDPNQPLNVVTSSPQGRTYLSVDGGTTWTASTIITTINGTGDDPWMSFGPAAGFQTPGYTPPPSYGYSGGSYGISMGAFAFDSASNLYCSHGFGILESTNPFANWNTAITWNSKSRGTEALDTTCIVHPPHGNPIGTAWDLPIWNFPNYLSNPTSYPAYYGPTTDFNGPMPNYGVQGVRGWHIDYASSAPNPAFLVSLTAAGGFYSPDSGVSWTIFPAQTPFTRSFFSGSVASSTATNHIAWCEGDVPYFTTNNGTGWTACTYAGNQFGVSFAPSTYVCADRVTANKFYIYSEGDGFYSSTNSGTTFTKVSSFHVSTGQPRFKAVPGNAGHVFWTPGISLNALPQTSDFLYWNTNSAASSSSGATDLWNTLSDFNSVFDFGFGTVVSGQAYPTIYLAAYRISTGVLGVYKCINFNPSTGTGTWTLMTNSDGTALPEGWFAPINSVAGDPAIDGSCSIAYQNGGFKRYG